jgi:AcrR family transcriptional regulator
MLSKADRTRQFIIEKAAHLFNTKGFSGTSMADILEATGLAKGGIYGNFSSKEEIAQQAFEYAVKTVMDEVSLKVRAKTTAPEKLKAVIDYYRNYSIHSPIQGGCPLLNTSCDVDDTWPQMRAQVAQSVRNMLDGLIRIIERGKEKGEIKDNINAEDVADLMFSQIEGAILLGRITGNPKKLNRVLEHLKMYIDTSLTS